MNEKMPILGRERALIDLLTETIHGEINHHEITPIRQRRQGNSFEVRIFVDGEPTGRIAKVTVELERVE